MSIHPNINGVHKEMTDGWVNINGVWRKIDSIYSNVNGVWREGYSGIAYIALIGRSLYASNDMINWKPHYTTARTASNLRLEYKASTKTMIFIDIAATSSFNKKSTDGGLTWSNNSLSGAENSTSGLSELSYIDGSYFLYFNFWNDSDAYYFTSTNGSSWTKITPSDSKLDVIYDARLVGNYLWVGTGTTSASYRYVRAFNRLGTTYYNGARAKSGYFSGGESFFFYSKLTNRVFYNGGYPDGDIEVISCTPNYSSSTAVFTSSTTSASWCGMADGSQYTAYYYTTGAGSAFRISADGLSFSTATSPGGYGRIYGLDGNIFYTDGTTLKRFNETTLSWETLSTSMPGLVTSAYKI